MSSYYIKDYCSYASFLTQIKRIVTLPGDMDQGRRENLRGGAEFEKQGVILQGFKGQERGLGRSPREILDFNALLCVFT